MQMMITGMSFKTSPVSVREKISFSEAELKYKLIELASFKAIREVLILSTCNRTEFYIITDDLDQAKESLFQFLKEEKNINIEELEPYFYTYYNKFAAEHLYRVTAGIESLILGEGEILSQIKDAFYKALDAGTTSKILNSLFRFAIETGKKVRTETTINQRPTSTGSVAAKIAKDHFEDLSQKTALLIGAGKIGQITAKNLKSEGVGNLIIANRTFEKALDLANELDGQAIKYDEYLDYAHNADVVIVAVGAPEYLLDINNYKNETKDTLIVDLSIPRNVDLSLSQKENITLYDIDSLDKVSSANKEEREQIIQEAECIIYEDMQKFVEWYNALDLSPVIASLGELFEGIRKHQVEVTVKKHKLDENSKKVVDIVTKAITQKILHYPVTNLKMTEDPQLKAQYIEDMKYLFQLEADDVFEKYFRKRNTITAPKLEEDSSYNCPFAKN
jgi:glutamyl-tRNA reductase